MINKKIKSAFLTIIIFIFSVEILHSFPQWGAGVTVSAAVSSQGSFSPPSVISDQVGGAIAAWMDMRAGNLDVYAGRVDAYGNTVISGWTADGIPVCTAAGTQQSVAACSDMAGGIIIAWADLRGSNQDIYAQRINAAGTVMWAANGVTVCVDSRGQSTPAIVSDGAGGAIVIWLDGRGDGDLYAQKISSGGGAVWAADGVPVCAAAGKIDWFTAVPGVFNSAYIAWQDKRADVNGDVYALRLDTNGAAPSGWATNGNLVAGGAGAQLMGFSLATNSYGDVYIPVITGNDHTLTVQRIDTAGIQWYAPGGITVTTSGTVYCGNPVCAPDGNDGILISWTDDRNAASGYDVFAQRMNGSGSMLWTAGGVTVSSLLDQQTPYNIIPDGSGGGIFAYYFDASFTLYLQKFDYSGAGQWGANGLNSNITTSNCGMSPDGAGGVITMWGGDSGGATGYDLYAQRFWSALPPTATNTPVLTQTPTSTVTPSTTPALCNTGKTAAQGLFGGHSPNWTAGSKFIFGTGTLVEIRMAMESTAGNITAAIYDDSGAGGLAGNLVASAGSVAAAAGWNTIPITGTISVPGTYWIMIQYSGINQYDQQSGVIGSSCIADAGSYGTWPASLSAFGPNNIEVTVYAVMSSCGAVPTITNTATYSLTSTYTPSPTLTGTPSFTETNTPLYTFTYTVTPSPTQSNTPAITWTNTPAASPSLTQTSTYTSTDTPVNTPAFTSTLTPTITPTQTPAIIPTATSTAVQYNFEIINTEDTYAAPDPAVIFTNFNYRLDKDANPVVIDVYNFAGIRVAKVREGNVQKGLHRIRMNVERFAPGVYYYTVIAYYLDGEIMRFKPSKFMVAR